MSRRFHSRLSPSAPLFHPISHLVLLVHGKFAWLIGHHSYSSSTAVEVGRELLIVLVDVLTSCWENHCVKAVGGRNLVGKRIHASSVLLLAHHAIVNSLQNEVFLVSIRPESLFDDRWGKSPSASSTSATCLIICGWGQTWTVSKGAPIRVLSHMVTPFDRSNFSRGESTPSSRLILPPTTPTCHRYHLVLFLLKFLAFHIVESRKGLRRGRRLLLVGVTPILGRLFGEKLSIERGSQFGATWIWEASKVFLCHHGRWCFLKSFAASRRHLLIWNHCF